MAIDTIARGMAASNSGGGGGGINADIAKGVGIEFEGTDPITIKNSGVTSVSESSTNGTINVSNGGKTPVQVPVHGLGSAAYKSENDFLGSGVKYASSDSVGGSANSAKKLANTEAIGSSTNAVYFNENGMPVACTYEVNEDVPSGAKFTDTTYTISTGDSSGEIKITSSDGDEYSVKVKDLNNAAYKDVADSIAENNEGLVTSGLAYTELNKKVDKTSVTNSVETGNANPVTSGAVYSALTKKADKTIFDVENAGLTPKSTNVNGYLKGDGSWSVPDNTTYTISEGSSNGTIKVTSSDKPNKPVSVPVHGLGIAAYKNVDTSVAENSENLITSGAVSQAINELPNPMLFKGSLGTGGTITYLPTATPENEGYTYKVITAGSYSGKTAKVGDVFISNGSEWIIVPSGDEPNGTVTSVGMSVPTGLKIKGGTSPVTTSGTIEVLLDDGYVIPKEADIVPSTRKINNITLESDVILDGDDIKATGYVKAESKSDIVGTDTINQAVGKLEYKIDTNETNISNVVNYINNGDFEEDSEVKMVKTVPNDVAGYAGIKKIGGRTQNFNQICNNTTLTLNGSASDNYSYDSTTNTISFRFKSNNAGCYQRVTKSTDKYYIRTTAKTTSSNSNVIIRIGIEGNGTSKDTTLPTNVAKTISYICTPTTTNRTIIFYFMNATSGDACSIQNTMIINLTAMFGAGNEPTIAEFEAMFPESYYPYTEGELWNAPVESVVSVGKNFSPINSGSVTPSDGGCLIGTTSNPQSINLFSGKYIISYNQTTSTGQTEFKFYDSIGNTISKTITNSSSVNVEITFDKPIVKCTMFCNKPTTITNFMIRLYDTDSSYVPYNKTTLLIPDSIKSLPDYGVRNNYVDFENMKYHHIDSKRAYEDGDVDSDTVITDGVNETVYQLATEEVIDISDMLMPIRCESGGTITFQNEHNLDMPNTVVYKKEVLLS